MGRPGVVAQSTQANNTNTFNRRSIAKLVGIVFHSDLYTGRCKLYPVDNAAGRDRLEAMARKPEDWCQPELMVCCARHRTACFFTSEIMQDPDKPNRWVCFLEDPFIPTGRYMLEVQRTKGRPIFQLVQVKGKMFAQEPVSGCALDHSEGSPVELMTDFMVGDGVSLEEALYNLCSYRYEASIGAMRESDMEKVGEGKAPESGFKTAIGIAHSTQEMIAHTIGIVKLDFPFYNNLKKVEKFLAGDKGRFTRQIIFLWEKSKLKQSVLNFTRDKEHPNVDGLLVWMEEDEGKLKRLSGLGIIEANYLEKYREKMDEYKIRGKVEIGKLSEGIEIVGAGFAMLDNVIETAEMIEKFNEAWTAWEHMGEELGRVSRRILKVPLDDQPWLAHGGGWFMRGDLTMLEHLKMVADNAAANAQDAGWKWFMKMLPQAVGFCEFGQLMKEIKPLAKAQKGYAVAKVVAVKADQMLHSNIADVYQKQIATKWHDLNAWIANDNALMYHAIGMTAHYWEQESIALQFYVRAKVIYGLKRLIDMCGPLGGDGRRRVSKYNFVQCWLAPGTTFEQAVDEMQVGRYISELCLAEGFWVRKDHLIVDWLHHWLQERDPAHRNEIIRTTAPDDPARWFKVEFQRFWPIHHSDILDVHKFAERFSTDWSSVDDRDVETCFLEYGVCEWQREILKITEWKVMPDRKVIDSETPVRAVLVFKKGAQVRPGLPVTFQIERTDWLNVPGPIYTTVVRPLQFSMAVECGEIERDEYLVRYMDQLGAIVSFSYSYAWKKKGEKEEEPAKVFYGFKPMIESTEWKEALKEFGFTKVWGLARNAKQWLHPSTMDFAVKYVVANGEAEGYVKTAGRFWDSTSEFTVQPGHITGPRDPEFDERNKAKFTDLEFLQRQLPEAPPPKPVYPKLDTVVVQFQAGQEWKAVTGAGISANDPVRIVFVFKEKALRVPVVVLIKRTDYAVNLPGPHYTANVVSLLDNLGPEFKGKWGVVITPEYYMMQWIKPNSFELRVELLNGGELWRGIKPITRDEICSKGHAVTAQTWAGYKFSVYYGVGTDDPREASDVASIPHSIMNDIPMAVGDQIGSDGMILKGYGTFGVSYWDAVLYHGAHLTACGMPFIANVFDSEGNSRPWVFGEDAHLYMQAVEDDPNLYNVVAEATVS